MISDPGVIVKVDEETNPAQNDRDPEGESEEEHVADEPGAAGEHAEINLVVVTSWTASRPEKEEEKEEA